MSLFNYLLRASICMAVGYLPYSLIFKKLTFFYVNRFYLLLIVTASLVFPALHINITEPLPLQHIKQGILLTSNGDFESENFTHALKAATYAINWQLIASFCYVFICIIMITKLLFNIFKIISRAMAEGVNIENNYIIETGNKTNASFFNIIFVCSAITHPLELEQILAHEKAHVRLLHSVDNIFIELVKAFFWFNPVVYYIKKSLKETHEYQVDDYLKQSYNTKEYASLLLKLSVQAPITLTNQFSAYSLKARIKMLFSARSQSYKKLYYLPILPLLFVAGYILSVEKVYGKTPVKQNFVLVLDAGHGGNEWGSASSDGHREKDMALLMVKEIKLVAAQRNITTILTRSDDSFLDIHNRVNNKADAFISIHMNAIGYIQDKKSNGMMIFVNKNPLYPLSKKLEINLKTSLEQLKGINAEHGIMINETQNLYTLKHNKAPSVLIELGYITNKNDLNYVLDQHNRQAIAEKIIDAVIAYGNAN